jgi:hypothetical protein
MNNPGLKKTGTALAAAYSLTVSDLNQALGISDGGQASYGRHIAVPAEVAV